MVTESEWLDIDKNLITRLNSLAMNVLRMIKLFGWEKKMNEQIREKREVELTWIWKFKLLDLANNALK